MQEASHDHRVPDVAGHRAVGHLAQLAHVKDGVVGDHPGRTLEEFLQELTCFFPKRRYQGCGGDLGPFAPGNADEGDLCRVAEAEIVPWPPPRPSRLGLDINANCWRTQTASQGIEVNREMFHEEGKLHQASGIGS